MHRAGKLCQARPAVMREFLVEAARLSPAISLGIRKLRQRADSAIRDAAIADTVLDARDAKPDDVAAARQHRPSSPIGVTPGPHGDAAVERSWSTSLLSGVEGPDAFAVKPLHELELLALRSAQQLRRRHARLRQTTFAVGAVALSVLGAGLYTGMQGDVGLAAGLVLGGLVAFALVVLKWQPFLRAARSAQLAEMADAMATNLRLRMRALDEIVDAKARQLEQWKTVLDVTESVHHPRAPAA
jgi:hypothetical protein